MKLLAIILSLYFLGLNAIPCGDSEMVGGDDTQKVSVIDHEGGHDGAYELCSPFCQCHCCHVHTVDFGITTFEPMTHSIVRENFVHFDGLGKEVAFSLFQPPRY
ncbi:DUF6660 family protein [Flagellimonas amoyensis]|uniref:DUF6660 family protein n=1 Tax=Flagellimonas amoyensis TaxID=2169401 RepID=UPI000D3904E3|nr:DUF6660 family protein [Allomuricauda amoyensis]